MRDARGWYWHEKARIALCYWAFIGMDRVYYALHRLFGKGLYLPLNGRMGCVWLYFAAHGYLYGDWRNHDMPEHKRAGGVWT